MAARKARQENAAAAKAERKRQSIIAALRQELKGSRDSDTDAVIDALERLGADASEFKATPAPAPRRAVAKRSGAEKRG